MKTKTRRTRFAMILWCCSLLVAAEGLTVTGAQDDQEKGIRAEEFLDNRPPMNPSRKTAQTHARYKATNKPPAGTVVATKPPAGLAFAEVGVTTWRFRKSTARDRTKELVEVDAEEGPVEFTLERVQNGTPFITGQIVRLSIESLSRDGYLYVIDREQYADGSLSDPLLIFPSRRLPKGNQVKAGRVISIPSAKGKGFKIEPKPSGKKQVAELLTIVVSATPLVDTAKLGTKPYLPAEQVAEWESKWGTVPTTYEMDGGTGQAMTEQEQAAAADSSVELTQGDPGPQTVYRVPIKPENPVIFSVPLKLRDS